MRAVDDEAAVHQRWHDTVAAPLLAHRRTPEEYLALRRAAFLWPAAAARSPKGPEPTPQEAADAEDRKRGLRTVVLSLDGQDLPYFQRIAENLWGQSVLERLFDRLLAFDSTTQGAAQLVYKAHLRTYKIEGLRDIIAAGGPILEGLVKQIDFIRSTQTNEGMTLMDSKDEFEAHSYAFGGLDAVLLQFAQQLSGALDIPLTRLFGQSPAGLNSTGESDLRTYYDGINQQQERRLRSGVETLLRLTYLSTFGKPMPDGSDFTFRPLWQLTEVEKGTLAAQLTTAITSACTSSIVGRQTALKELRQQSKLTGVWSNISDEDINAADNDVNTGEFETGGVDPFGEKDENPRSGETEGGQGQ